MTRKPNTVYPTDAENFLAQIDELVAQAREDDRLCYDQIPSQRYADARERIVSAVIAKWGSPAPASHPVAAPSAPLTDSQIADIYVEALGSQHLREQDRKMVTRFARAIEQAHGIKATNQESNK